jgi:hypothetical protein
MNPIQIILLYCLPLIVLATDAVAASADSSVYRIPVCFTANRGQWDPHVRYALISGESSIWFCEDEIVFSQPSSHVSIPGERLELNQSGNRDLVRMRFTNQLAGRELYALDTLSGVANFYHGSDRSGWFENVSTHAGIRYAGIANGVDLEFRIRPVEAIVSDADGILDIRMLASTGASGPDSVAQVMWDSKQIQCWLDCNELHSYLAYLTEACNDDTRTILLEPAAEGRRISLLGYARSNTFPVANAIQPGNRGESDVVIVGYNALTKQVGFSSYLGSSGNEGYHGSADCSVSGGTLRIKEAHTFLAIQGGYDFPVICNLPGTIVPDSGQMQAVLIKLDANGVLRASSFLGGPGVLEPYTIEVSEEMIFMLGGVNRDKLNQITANAVEPIASIAQQNDDWGCGYFCVLTADIDSIIYASYIDPATTAGGWKISGGRKGGCVSISPVDSAVVFTLATCVDDNNETPLFHSQLSKQNIDYFGSYLVKLSPPYTTYDYAIIFGFPDRSFWPKDILLHSNGYCYLTGHTWSDDGEMDGIPGIWHRYGADTSYTSSMVIARINPQGEIEGGVEFCASAVPWCAGIYEGLCGDIVWTGTLNRCQSFIPPHHFPFINAFDTSFTYWKAANTNHYWDNLLVSIEPQQMLPYYASLWNHKYVIDTEEPMFILQRPNGYLHYAAEFNNGVPANHHSWHMLGPDSEYGWCAADIRIPTPCWTILCDIVTLDTLRIERRRGYAIPPEFDVQYEVSNASTLKEAQILQALIELPPGFELVSGQPMQQMTPALLTPGLSAHCSWRLRLRDASLVGDSALIRCRVMYYDPESGETYPVAEELCVHDLVIVRFDEPEKNIVCTINGTDTLFWTGDGFAGSAGGSTGPIRYTATYTNLEADTIDIDAFTFRAAEYCHILGSAVLPGVRLAPDTSHVLHVDVEVDALQYARMIRIDTDARDTYDLAISSCATETQVPGVRDLPCAVTGPARIRWYPKSGTAYPNLVTLTLHLENPIDTVRAGVRSWIDMSSAPHLSLAPGDSAARPSVAIAVGGAYDPYWRFMLTHPPTSAAFDTVRFLYATEGMQYECTHVIAIDVILIEKSVVCDLVGTDSLSLTQIQSRTPAQLQYTLTNTGTVAVYVDRYELAIIPAAGFREAGLISLDPLVRAGGSIDPGDDITMDWNLHALILRASRTAVCTATAYDANDSVLAVCTHTIALEGLDGLICTMTATDSVRFNRAELRYDPEEITASFSLENLLDTEETNIASIIDLTQAPRFVLDPSESVSKIIATIDSHATASLTWKLLPQPAPVAEGQQVTVRYRSDQMSGWKECTATIHIEAWPEEPGITCETGGHDSLFADWHEERFIPDTLHLSYTVTNTGTVALTGCEASIVLPSAFSLAGSDSTQSFTAPEYANQPGGPVPEGILLPGASCSRWWKITPAQNIADNDPRLVTWIWKSNEQGTESGCTHIVNIIPENPPSILLTPLHLYFEAERGGALPVEQQVQLWTGGGLSMPWTTQPSEWWLDAQPTSGSQSTQISVQPNSTMLEVGAHGADLLFAATPTDRHVTITYVIRKSTGIESPVAPGALTLDVWPQPVAVGARLYVHIGDEAGGSCRLTLHDLLGRERLTRYAETASPVVIDLSVLQLPTGVYLLRAIAEDGAQATRMISVTGGR